MSETPETRAPAPRATAAKVAGHIGLWTSAAVVVLCVALVAVGVLRSGAEIERAGASPGVLILQGLLFGAVAGLGVWLFHDFVKLPDWTLAPEVPSGLKLLGHLGRVLGSLAAAACIALVVMTVVFPDHVPPVRRRPATEQSAEARLEASKNQSGPKEEQTMPTDLGRPRPALAALYVFGIFVSLLVRLFGSAISELRTWARVGSLVAVGAAVALLTVGLILSFTKWDSPSAQAALGLFGGAALALFVFLLVYFTLPHVVDAFEARRL